MAVELALVLVLVGASTSAVGQKEAAPAQRPEGVQVEMRNIHYHFTDEVATQISRLRGTLVPTPPNTIPVFDDKQSFVVHIETAEIALPVAALANILNRQVLAAEDSPLKDISISIDQGRLKIKGKLHHQGDIGFETEGTLSATPEGKVRLHAEKIRAMHLPVKGLMDLLGIEIADLIKTSKLRGIRAEEDDLVLDPEQILPPPHIHGRVTAVLLRGNDVVQVFGTQAAGERPMFAGNYMAYRGKQLRFGKLTMSDTDMVLIDMDPKDPFDFYLDHYKEQLVAGYTKETAAFGLRVYMRDFNKLRGAGHQRRAVSRP
jgi:hypothetical protein